MSASKPATTETRTPRKSRITRAIPDPSLMLRPTSIDDLDLSTRQLAVVGGTNGLGRAIAQQALACGAEVTVVGRTFRDAPHSRLSFVPADLSSMKEAARVGAELPVESFDLLLFTTGIIAAPRREETAEGIERDLAISYLSRLAILQGAGSRLGTARQPGAPKPRVFVMGSPGGGELGDPADLNSEESYKALAAHANTIAGNEILILGAEKRFPGPAFFGLAPGLIRTGIRSNFLGEGSIKHRLFETVIGLLSLSAETYAERIVPLLFAPELEDRTAVMFNNKAQPILPTQGIDATHIDKFLTASEILLHRIID